MNGQVSGVDHFDSLTLRLRGCVGAQRDSLLLLHELIVSSLLGLVIAFDSTKRDFNARNLVQALDDSRDRLFVVAEQFLLPLDFAFDEFELFDCGADADVRSL